MGVGGLLFLAALCVAWFCVFLTTKPPQEKALLEAFSKHRAVYEQLREMLLADENVRAVSAISGIETATSGLPRPPEQVNFAISRYNEYRSLLQQVNSPEVFRGLENNEVCISIWASGFAGDTRHIAECWLARAPAHQVSSLADFYKAPKPRHPVFRHVDGNWYLWADW